MEVCRRSSWLLLLLGVSLLATTLQGVQGEVDSEGPSESECRPYIEKALKELEIGETGDPETPATGDSKEDVPTVEITTDDSVHENSEGDDEIREEGDESIESVEVEQSVIGEQHSESKDTQEGSTEGTETKESVDKTDEDGSEEAEAETSVEDVDSKNASNEKESEIDKTESAEQLGEDNTESAEDTEETIEKTENKEDTEEAKEESEEETADANENTEDTEEEREETEQEVVQDSREENSEKVDDTQEESTEKVDETKENSTEDEQAESTADDQSKSTEQKESEDEDEGENEQDKSVETQTSEEKDDQTEESDHDETKADDKTESKEDDKSEANEDDSTQNTTDDQESSSAETEATGTIDKESEEQNDNTLDEAKPAESKEDTNKEDRDDESQESAIKVSEETEKSKEESEEKSDEDEDKTSDEKTEEFDSAPEEELSLDIEIPTDLRERHHVEQLLKLDDEASETEKIVNRVAEITLRELKKLYENAIKPLEVLYKYRDLSNRHFGDSEIFSKPLILFMGPWSGGKSSIINYLLDNEYNETSLRTGAEPSPAYFNILMYGEESEVIDGTQLAADFTFSGLQKFGQGLEERLRGVKLPSKLLEKVNIVEIPGILEVRKQVSRVFPFNDACQWFIDRADIIFLVYDPSKLDVGPETEAILDQLKGREHQTRIILNKADQVKPEELMRVQGALIWNISPLMSSAQPPVMYTTSLWSRPYEGWAPVRLLQAQERAFLRDLRSAVDKRIENKIASARRFAVRVRNHAKMVDCYLTTYYNHKSVFGNRKQVADEIIEHPQDYHIYEGLSTLTNISRYDLPDPDVYKDFFKLNPLYDFQQLSATCTYFRGCPINRLDVAIAYDLPELIGKHKRLVESDLAEANQATVPGS